MVVLLLLPVISLSDDLMAMQGPAETDTSLRRALHPDDPHPSATQASFALPEEIVTGLILGGLSPDIRQDYKQLPPAALFTRSFDSRPPPRA
jgi:hypothetical protein